MKLYPFENLFIYRYTCDILWHLFHGVALIVPIIEKDFFFVFFLRLFSHFTSGVFVIVIFLDAQDNTCFHIFLKWQASKELYIWFAVRAKLWLNCFPLFNEGRIRNLIISFPYHCLSVYFVLSDNGIY